MRISIEPTDPGYAYWQECEERGKLARVYCNGVQVNAVITVDTDEGFILRDVTDADGNPVTDETGDAFKRETLRGDIEIKFIDAEVSASRAANESVASVLFDRDTEEFLHKAIESGWTASQAANVGMTLERLGYTIIEKPRMAKG